MMRGTGSLTEARCASRIMHVAIVAIMGYVLRGRTGSIDVEGAFNALTTT
jgi:hypothetical protein